MKLLFHYKTKTTLISSFILSFLYQLNPAIAWDGNDIKNNSTIQIEAGNLVREGSIIDFFDSVDGNYHTGKVITMNSVSHGTELVIEDFTDKHKERFFLMNE